MTYEKTFQGAHKISDVIGGYLVTKQYFFCSKKEAMQDFKNEFKKASR